MDRQERRERIENEEQRREVFKPGEIAKICHVVPRTVTKWIDSGILVGYRLPGGSRDRRVIRAELQAFITRSGMPFTLPE